MAKVPITKEIQNKLNPYRGWFSIVGQLTADNTFRDITLQSID